MQDPPMTPGRTRQPGKRSLTTPLLRRSAVLVNTPPRAVLETAGLKLTGSRLIIEIRRDLVVSGISDLDSSWFGACGVGVWEGPSGGRPLVEERDPAVGHGEADGERGAATR
ncbi:hypothetical protein GCM10009734_49660 [Nonomuraea bangladeshensis]